MNQILLTAAHSVAFCRLAATDHVARCTSCPSVQSLSCVTKAIRQSQSEEVNSRTVFYETRRFITTSRQARHWHLSWYIKSTLKGSLFFHFKSFIQSGQSYAKEEVKIKRMAGHGSVDKCTQNREALREETSCLCSLCCMRGNVNVPTAMWVRLLRGVLFWLSTDVTLPVSSWLKMEAVCSYQTFSHSHDTTRRNKPGDSRQLH